MVKGRVNMFILSYSTKFSGLAIKVLAISPHFFMRVPEEHPQPIPV
jgi:hypothetical protein